TVPSRSAATQTGELAERGAGRALPVGMSMLCALAPGDELLETYRLPGPLLRMVSEPPLAAIRTGVLAVRVRVWKVAISSTRGHAAGRHVAGRVANNPDGIAHRQAGRIQAVRQIEAGGVGPDAGLVRDVQLSTAGVQQVEQPVPGAGRKNLQRHVER